MGDFDGDNLDDVLAWFPQSISIRYTNSGNWQEIMPPKLLLGISAGDHNGDGKDEIYLNRQDGVYYKDLQNGDFIQLAPPSIYISVGDINGDGKGDLVGIWGYIPILYQIKIRYSGGVWETIELPLNVNSPAKVATGDINDDGKDDIIAVFPARVYWRNSANSVWQQLSNIENYLIASGDINAGGKDDYIKVENSNSWLWVTYSENNTSELLLNWTPSWIAAGKMRNPLSIIENSKNIINEKNQQNHSLESPLKIQLDNYKISNSLKRLKQQDLLNQAVKKYQERSYAMKRKNFY